MFRVSHAVYIMSAPGTTLISAGGAGGPPSKFPDASSGLAWPAGLSGDHGLSLAVLTPFCTGS